MSWWGEIGRAIQPIFGAPGTGAGGGGAFNMSEFLRITGQFWAAVRAADIAGASAAFDRAILYVAETGGASRTAGAIARMESALVELEAALEAAAAGAIEAAPGAVVRGGGTFLLGEGGMILVVVFFGLWILRGGGAQAAYAESSPSSSWPARQQPHPVYTEEQWRRITEQPNGWRTLIVGPAPARPPGQETRFAARIMLERMRAYRRGRVQGPVQRR
jgi:hypothetical protein